MNASCVHPIAMRVRRAEMVRAVEPSGDRGMSHPLVAIVCPDSSTAPATGEADQVTAVLLDVVLATAAGHARPMR